MIKNLRNILTLSLALLSTVSFAQDWSVDSRTRADMSGANSQMLVDQRATISTSLGGDNWGVHLSSDVNFTHQDGTNGMLTSGVYEAYAKTNLFSFADLTIGRQAWDFGSGALIGSNQWAGVRTTRDGMLFDIKNDMVDLSLGYSLYNTGGDGEEDWTYTLVNASKSFGDITANALVIQQNDGVNDELTATGIDLGYSAMGGALDLMLGANTVTMGDDEMDMMMIGATYSVSDNLSVRASQTTYGEKGFALMGTNMGYSPNADSWLSHGNLGYLEANDENLSIGLDYSMGGIDISYTMHTITNSETDYEAEASEVTVGYNLNDNASLSLKYANDNRYNADGDDYMWLTLTVAP
jgi:hypothetical protein